MTARTVDHKEIGNRIKAKRISISISQTNLGKLLGISRTHMSNIENGNAGITLDNLVKMAGIFQCSIDSIVFGDSVCAKTYSTAFEVIKNCTMEEFAQAVQMLKVLK